MANKCPICGNLSLEVYTGEFQFEPPPNIPGGTISIPDAKWKECSSCKEKIIPVELEAVLEQERYRRLGLLPPKKIREMRQSTGLGPSGPSTVQDEHFKGDKGKEIAKRLDGLCDWARGEETWIKRDRFLDRRWWDMIDSIEVVVMRLQSYENEQKHEP